MMYVSFYNSIIGLSVTNNEKQMCSDVVIYGGIVIGSKLKMEVIALTYVTSFIRLFKDMKLKFFHKIIIDKYNKVN